MLYARFERWDAMLYERYFLDAANSFTMMLPCYMACAILHDSSRDAIATRFFSISLIGALHAAANNTRHTLILPL